MLRWGDTLLFGCWMTLLACQRSPIEAAQADCSQSISGWSATELHVDLYPGLSDGCVEALAGPVGLDVRSRPELESPSAYVLTALLALLSDDTRTLGEDQDSATLPRFGLAQHQEAAALFELGKEAPAGGGWFAVVASATDSVQVMEAAELDGAQMRYRASENAIFITSDLPGWSEAFAQGLPLQVGLLLVHEAAHARAPAHIDCTRTDGAGCDEDMEGAYGLQLWLAQEWMASSPELLAHPACEQQEALGQGSCRSINEPVDWAICTGEKLCD